MRTTKTWSDRKPSGTSSRRRKLRVNKPAVNSSVRDSATSATITALRSLTAPADEVTALLLSRSESCKQHREARSAGARPNTSTVPTAAHKPNKSTAPFISTTDSEAIVNAGIEADNILTPPHARKIPATAPPIAKRRLSTRSWLISRARLAPSAARTANSLSRVVARASNRFATFPQPMRSEEHTSELQSRQYLVCRLLLEKKKTNSTTLISDTLHYSRD